MSLIPPLPPALSAYEAVTAYEALTTCIVSVDPSPWLKVINDELWFIDDEV